MTTAFRPQFPSFDRAHAASHRGAPNAELVLIRGLPGSGKTTMASVPAQVGYAHFEADLFFITDGVYSYDASRIRDAHAWCQRKTREALASGRRVVVSNSVYKVAGDAAVPNDDGECSRHRGEGTLAERTWSAG